MLLTRGKLNHFLCHWWIPVGFALFLTGLFWAPDSHAFKVAIPLSLLLPALLYTLLNASTALSALRLPAVWLTLLYLIYMVMVASARSSDDVIDFSKWSLYITLFLLAIGAYMNISERALALFLLGAATVAAGAGIYAIYRDVGSGFFWQPLYRLRGYATLYNELRTGFLLGAFTLFAFWCMLNASLSRWQRYLGAAAAMICLATTILTGSRAPLLALTVVGIAIAAAEKRWSYGVLVTTISAIILTVFWDRLSERGVSLRPEIWRYVWEQCLAHPWFGAGLSRAPIEVPTSAGIKYNTHNIFLAVFYQGGGIGLLLFMAVIGTTLYRSWHIRRISAVATLAVLLQIYAIVALQFDGISLITRPADNWFLLWLPIALHMYACRVAAGRVPIAPLPPSPRSCAA